MWQFKVVAISENDAIIGLKLITDFSFIFCRCNKYYFRHNKSLAPLRKFLSFIFFNFPPLWPLIFGLPLLYFRYFPLTHIFSPAPSLSLSLSWIFLNPLPLLLSSSLLKTHHFFSKISNTKVQPKTTKPTQSKVSLSSSHVYFVAIFVYIYLLLNFWFFSFDFG